FASAPDLVSTFGAIVLEELQNAGITPVIKHIPGHGRGTVDSHLELPVVSTPRDKLANADFIPFKVLSSSPWGMTAHIVFDKIDPDWPATQSAIVIKEIIREEIGFEGLLLTDDLNMQALKGTLDERASRALEAGVDIVLHCSGILEEMKTVAAACRVLTEDAIGRIEKAQVMLNNEPVIAENQDELVAELKGLMTLVEVE
ncbi:MAG: glycoside hydrolase family 3 protein, partial [Sneathiella sp.]|nr:glycoside hydrolase family 3 protein [Sneathiella sp.]